MIWSRLPLSYTNRRIQSLLPAGFADSILFSLATITMAYFTSNHYQQLFKGFFMNYYLIVSFLTCATTFGSGLASYAQEATIAIAPRDLENLAIIDTIHGTTLEKRLNHCSTMAGKAYFEQSLRELSADKAQLEQRQNHLKEFLKDRETLGSIQASLKTCGSMEEVFHKFTGAASNRPLLDEFYFKRAQCARLNSSPSALSASFFLHYINLFAPLIEHALLHVGINSLFSSLSGHDHDHDDHHEHHHHEHGGCGCSHGHGISKETALYYVVQGAHWALHVPGYYEMLTHMQTRRKKISSAQADIAHLKNYLTEAHTLHSQIAKINSQFLITNTPTLNRLFDPNEQDPATTMVASLMNSSWDSSLQNTFSPGSILAMHAEIEKQAALLQQVAQEIGIIDAYIHVAHLIDTQTPQAPYCFVTFKEGNQPSVDFQSLWHHGISCDAMRPLTITLDASNRCLVIQGANGTGKSTLLTATGQALFLAQSWGIAPARQATLTPFSKIHTHSLKRDSIEQGLSHFYCEHAYYEDMFAQDEANKEMSIALFDEPYTCTDPETGASYLNQLTDRIKRSPNKIAVMTTHYAV